MERGVSQSYDKLAEHLASIARRSVIPRGHQSPIRPQALSHHPTKLWATSPK